jgi:glycosyltransferase involved in cell wall biosynthesis
VIDPTKDVLFIGQGDSASAWYRCFMPALQMGADWVGIVGDAPRIGHKTGIVRGSGSRLPDLRDYKIVVVQQARGRGWFKTLRALQEQHGVKVVYECDDYLHGIRKKKDHDYAQHFDKDNLKEFELCMGMADAMICSTDFIARKYRKFTPTYVCPNGIDEARYRLTKPDRPFVNIGWAGATGHRDALIPWLKEVARVMQNHHDTAFISIGQPFANGFREAFPGRCISTPFAAIETYPAAMTLFDVAIAPAGKGLFYRAKSDLRFLEAGALGIPVVADPDVYPEIEHGVTGFHAANQTEAFAALQELVMDRELRQEVGAAAREYVLEHRTIAKLAHNWLDAFESILDGS